MLQCVESWAILYVQGERPGPRERQPGEKGRLGRHRSSGAPGKKGESARNHLGKQGGRQGDPPGARNENPASKKAGDTSCPTGRGRSVRPTRPASDPSGATDAPPERRRGRVLDNSESHAGNQFNTLHSGAALPFRRTQRAVGGLGSSQKSKAAQAVPKPWRIPVASGGTLMGCLAVRRPGIIPA